MAIPHANPDSLPWIKRPTALNKWMQNIFSAQNVHAQFSSMMTKRRTDKTTSQELKFALEHCRSTCSCGDPCRQNQLGNLEQEGVDSSAFKRRFVHSFYVHKGAQELQLHKSWNLCWKAAAQLVWAQIAAGKTRSVAINRRGRLFWWKGQVIWPNSLQRSSSKSKHRIVSSQDKCIKRGQPQDTQWKARLEFV